MNDSTHLFARDGHLTMLSLDRYDGGECDDAERRAVVGHVEVCARCRDRMSAVCESGLVILPPPRRDTGSVTLGYLATTAGVAMAAGLVAFVANSLWPNPRLATQSEVEAMVVASAYTSVASDDAEQSTPGLELEVRGEILDLRTEAGSTLIVARVSAEEDGGDTGGRGAELDELLLSAPSTGEAISLVVPQPLAGARVVAIACVDPTVALQAGDSLPTEGECTVREVPSTAVQTRDS